MSDILDSGQVILQPLPPKVKGNRVDFLKTYFDDLVANKGYRVYLDKAMDCPCANNGDNQGLSACKNCGGSGYFWINRTLTKMVMQAMNLDTKFKEWSLVNLGTVKITTLNDNVLSMMDRITILDALSTHTETLHGKLHEGDNKYRAMTIYPVVEIEAAFLFVNTETKLTRAIEGTHFSIVDNSWIEFLSPYGTENVTLSIRYRHRPTYYVKDCPRNIMTTNVLESGFDIPEEMPLHAVARIADLVLNRDNFNSDYLLDNSFEESCGTNYITPCT